MIRHFSLHASLLVYNIMKVLFVSEFHDPYIILYCGYK